MIKYIKFKKKLLAFLITKRYKPLKTNFIGSSKHSLQFGYILKNKNDFIKRHKHKKIKRTIKGTPEILIIKKGKVRVNIFYKKKSITSVLLSKNDLISIIDCEHSLKFFSKTVIQEIKQGPYFKDEKIIYD